MSEINFSKSNAFTRLTTETDSFMYDIVINNLTGEFIFQVNSQTVESFHVNNATKRLMGAWNIMQQDLIDFAQMNLTDSMYKECWHYLRDVRDSINAGTHWQIVTR